MKPFPCCWCGTMIEPGTLSPEHPHECTPGTWERIRAEGSRKYWAKWPAHDRGHW